METMKRFSSLGNISLKRTLTYSLTAILLVTSFITSAQGKGNLNSFSPTVNELSSISVIEAPDENEEMTYYCGVFYQNYMMYTVLSDLNNPSNVLYVVAEDGTAYRAFGYFDIDTRYANVMAGPVSYYGELY